MVFGDILSECLTPALCKGEGVLASFLKVPSFGGNLC